MKKLLFGLVAVSLMVISGQAQNGGFVTTNSLQQVRWPQIKATTIDATALTNVDTITANSLTVSHDTITTGNVQITGNFITVAGSSSTLGSALLKSRLTVGDGTVGPAGTAISSILGATGTVDIGSTATNAISTATLTVTGAGTNALGCTLNIPSPDTRFVYRASVTATNTVTIYAANISTGTVDPAAASMAVLVFQP